MPEIKEVRIAKRIATLLQQLGYSPSVDLNGFLELLAEDYEEAHVIAACHVALCRTWSRPPQPADLEQIIREFAHFAAAYNRAVGET